MRHPTLSAPRGLTVDEFELGEHRFVLLEWPAGRRAISAKLSPSEHAILKLLLVGLDNAEIARQRRRSARTVAHQVDSIFRRLGVRSRLELFALFARGTEEKP